MPSLYPQAQLLQIKPKERLSTLINKLERFQEFYGADKLLQQAQCLIDQFDARVIEINTCIGQIKNFIELNSPIKEKLEQINYLEQCINYCFKDDAHPFNSELEIQKDKLIQSKKNGIDNQSNSESFFGEIDSIFVNCIPELFNKIKEIYSERKLSSVYETYFNSEIGLIESIEGDRKNPHFLFQQLCWLMMFLNKFEYSYHQFNELQAKFKKDKAKFSKLCVELINSEIICDRKKTIEQQMEILTKDFQDFNPRVNPQQLGLGLIQLDTKINELSTLNKGELRDQQAQYAHLIDLLIDSKVNLTLHVKKLKSNFFWAQLGKNKYQAIEKIQQKMDALLESGANQEQARPSKQIVAELQQTINEAKTTLSVYRGIPLFRCFATLWGGGKVTSQLLVSTLEEQLMELQSNINRLQA